MSDKFESQHEQESVVDGLARISTTRGSPVLDSKRHSLHNPTTDNSSILDEFPTISSNSNPLAHLIRNNRLFVNRVMERDPTYFAAQSESQSPEILYIGCSDSRVPPNVITSTSLGELFVHRNIANLCCSTDMSYLCVLQYAVEFLKVKHIIVCGHYGCGGVQSAMQTKSFGLLDGWLKLIKDIYQINKTEIDAIPEDKNKLRKLVELNTYNSLRNVCTSNIVQNAWLRGQQLSIHAWVYDVGNGLISDLHLAINKQNQMDDIYHFDSK